MHLLLWTALSASGGGREQPGAAPARVVRAAMTGAASLGDVFWIPAEINGANRSLLIVDTGSPFTMLAPGVFLPILARGSARVRTLSLGNAVLGDAPVVLLEANLPPAPDGSATGGIAGFFAWGSSLLALDYRGQAVGIGEETRPADVAEPVRMPFVLEGGGTHALPRLAGEDVVVDYANRELRLRRYRTARNAHRYRRAAIELGPALHRKGHFTVRRVFPNSDAEQQHIRVGDEILAINGTLLADHTVDAANALLEGDSGTERVLTLIGRSVSVRVENVLPLGGEFVQPSTHTEPLMTRSRQAL
jgi:hypothetical protein